MKRNQLFFVLLCVLVLVTGTLSNPISAATASNRLRIGMANFTLGAPYFSGMSKAVQEEAAVYPNIQLFVTDAQSRADKLMADIEDMISKGVKGVIISGAVLESHVPALNALKKAKIPVVLVDRELKGGEYTSWVGPDNYQIGVNNGEYIAKRLNGKGNLVLLKGGPADNSIGLARTNGALSVLKKYSDIKVVATGWGEWNTEKAIKVMEDILAAHKDIDAVLCENDSMGLGAMIAIKNAKREKDIFIVGVDGQKEAIKAIIDGTNFECTGMNNSDIIGRAGFNRLMAILAGCRAPKKTVVDSPRIIRSNAARYYNPDSVF
ncbi:monosaccharide ABC transporter substrate-binding protein (CUT2 family) [Hydrogenispora ethanolica]|uniref:Monosaccharide ABC transporter substrate-binding protein (CUT2 family) n=1 Tax=Hydrogenispora ethanolica TaxID=1082276 RepID=A0A4R1RAI0_HYDET|nr:substrate-binding domain-containing protein [Hydrogenispora ethanolica]TCL62751.1 monosaccharide ABC transporter substrate-binding protein (CUT2 family) [Hydrogenispora ethanolica]